MTTFLAATPRKSTPRPPQTLPFRPEFPAVEALGLLARRDGLCRIALANRAQLAPQPTPADHDPGHAHHGAAEAEHDQQQVP